MRRPDNADHPAETEELAKLQRAGYRAKPHNLRSGAQCFRQIQLAGCASLSARRLQAWRWRAAGGRAKTWWAPAYSLAGRKKNSEVLIQVELSNAQGEPAQWIYSLSFKADARVGQEKVWRHTELILDRPNAGDLEDALLLSQTFLEQSTANKAFREIAHFFASTEYQHLVPALLKHKHASAGMLDDDPFGQGLLERIAACPEKNRATKLKRLQAALSAVVPTFQTLRFERDAETGAAHLEAVFGQQGAAQWQNEQQFSDGTLRLIGMLWSLQQEASLLLLEEPELSLNEAVVALIPLMIDRLLREQKASSRQVLITTHSEALLDNPLDGRSIILLETGAESSQARTATDQELQLMDAGLSPAAVLLPKAQPAGLKALGFS
ncbi:AAA family ATPase [Pseudomonas sp. KNUC1026]|uniref:AAA family ATPase n=1 Tax=Pseudomonas sp. KNUC1026 TaxID=2893890 RepID=UPI001F1FA207|nr:AAA family ATPase [Pseudomonas sp. KNUC1026]UFH48850.1 ATP-binding protein [Pseudomonas sp. KNUC1026]